LILNSTFCHNVADNSIIYVQEGNTALQNMTLSSVQFVNNSGSVLYLPKCNLYLSGSVHFSSNTASNGVALYSNHGTTIEITVGANVTFTNNMAAEYGGAVFVDVDPFLCHSGFHHLHGSVYVLFQGNIATFAGNLFYFSIPDSCSAVTNISNYQSICQFNYTQSSQNLPCIGNYTEDDDTFPVVTSPHMLILQFPNGSGGPYLIKLFTSCTMPLVSK